MANYTPAQMAAFLRMCGSSQCSDACPYTGAGGKASDGKYRSCGDAMMLDAAEGLEEVAKDG